MRSISYLIADRQTTQNLVDCHAIPIVGICRGAGIRPSHLDIGPAVESGVINLKREAIRLQCAAHPVQS
jgi:hypothetical protein